MYAKSWEKPMNQNQKQQQQQKQRRTQAVKLKMVCLKVLQIFSCGPSQNPTPQNGLYLWKSCACISYYLAIIPLRMYATISVIKNFHHNYPKIRRRSKAVSSFFSENSSDLVTGPFPKGNRKKNGLLW